MFRLAYFSPLPPSGSGIADYSAELLPALTEYAEIAVVTDGYTPSNGGQFRVVDDKNYRASDYDLALYQLGNSPPHAYIYRRALSEPGVVVLHDVVLHHLIAWLTLDHGDAEGYIAALGAAYGEEGAELARQEVLGLGSLDRFAYPLSERVVRASRGVIVHSSYAAEKVRAMAPGVPLARIPHEMPPVPLISRPEARARLGLSPSAPLIGTFGNLGPSKRTSVILEALAELRRTMPDAQLWIVGAPSPQDDVAGLLAQLNLQDAVQLTGHVPFETFTSYMAAMDGCVNLRYPTAGETSGAVLRMMAQGAAVLVSRVGWFAELPDDAVCHVDVDAREVSALTASLERALTDAAWRDALGANARAYVEQVCDRDTVARSYADFWNAVHDGNTPAWRDYAPPYTPVRRIEPRDVARPIDAAPLPPPTDWRAELASALVALGLGEDEATLRSAASAAVDLGLDG